MCEIGTVGRISDYQPEGLVERPSFATPSVDGDVKPLVRSLDVLSGDLKEHTLVGLVDYRLLSYKGNQA